MNTRNQQGGFLSSVFIIPAGVVVIIAVFLLGYYMGKRQATQTASGEKPTALPEVVSQYLPEKEEFTFYKTLTEKGEKTLSVDLKPRPKREPDTAVVAPESKLPEPGTSAAPKQEKPQQKPQQKLQPKQQATKTPPQPAREATATKSQASKIRYTIQVGSYPERNMADEEVRAMKKRGYAAFLVSTEIADKGTWYRVRVGSFSNKQSAEKLAAELKTKEGISSFITVE